MINILLGILISIIILVLIILSYFVYKIYKIIKEIRNMVDVIFDSSLNIEEWTRIQDEENQNIIKINLN
jgi:predicted PurR-regulated permease PerM